MATIISYNCFIKQRFSWSMIETPNYHSFNRSAVNLIDFQHFISSFVFRYWIIDCNKNCVKNSLTSLQRPTFNEVISLNPIISFGFLTFANWLEISNINYRIWIIVFYWANKKEENIKIGRRLPESSNFVNVRRYPPIFGQNRTSSGLTKPTTKSKNSVLSTCTCFFLF